MQWLRVLIGVAAIAVLAGCASAGGNVPKGPSDEELVTQALDGITAALQAGDIDKMVSFYADDFANDQGQDKAAMTQFLNSVKEQGFLEGITVDIANRAITVEGETASVTGVGLSGAFGVLNLGFKLAKREGQWLVTGQTQQ